MSIYKRGKVCWYKFMWNGELIRESTKQGSDKVARQMEAAHRTALAKGEVGIREKKRAPTLKEFLKQDFQKYAETRHAAKLLPCGTTPKGVPCFLNLHWRGCA